MVRSLFHFLGIVPRQLRQFGIEFPLMATFGLLRPTLVNFLSVSLLDSLYCEIIINNI